MLGRHVYRVHPAEGRWTVTKEGEDQARAECAGREEAIEAAVRLAQSDKPSKIIIAEGDGVLAEERLFGEDPGQEIGS